ncbi:unnamed protein product, partial [Lymnaea stagnalis]
MKISKAKIEVTSVCRQNQDFKYKGGIIKEDGKWIVKLETIMKLANALSSQIAPLLRHSRIKMETKARTIKASHLASI